MKKLWLAGVSLSVITALAVAVPAMQSVAHESAVEEKSRACEALGGDLVSGATDLQSGLVALPPKLDTVPQVVNGLLGQVTSLIDLGCLPAPELPVAAPLKGKDQLIPPIGGTLPTVPVCTDLTADLLDAVTGVLAALLSTGGLPDLTGALDAITDLLETLTSLTDTAYNCLPAPTLANR